MPRRLLSFAACLVACLAAGARADSSAPPRILYPNHPGSDRERDYVGFLKRTFPLGDVIDSRTFREEMADGHDVVILDWTSIYKRDAEGRRDDKSLEVAPRWQVAAPGGAAGPETPAFLRPALPPGLEPVGDWSAPEPTRDPAGRASYEGTDEFRHRARVAADAAPGRATIRPSAFLQACDAASCRPPTLRVVEVPREVVAP